MLKKLSKDRKILLLVIIGLFFVMFDQKINIKGFNPYPEYKTSYEYNGEFQYYTLNYHYGANATIVEDSIVNVSYANGIDILPDALGFMIMAYALIKLSKKSRIFVLSSFMAVFGAVASIIISILPFFINGMPLSYAGFWGGIALFGIEAATSYLFVIGVCDMLRGYYFSREKKAIVIAWFCAMVLNAVVCFIRWIAVLSPMLLITYEVIQLFVNLLFYYFVMSNSEYIVKDKEIEDASL